MFPTIRRFLAVLALIVSATLPASAAGVIPFALTQQIDANGRPLIGCKLNIYVVGTTATLQNIFSDFGLSLPLPNPLTCDATGRLPSFYLADGTVHVNLTDAGGLVLIDIPVMQVVGPSSGGGGGGSVDPNSILSTGDIKFRSSSEILGGWVKANGQTVGSATSGATGRANNDTQALFVYLWINCPNAHCPVSTGRGVSGLNDFNANKTIQVFDMRSRLPFGRDQMDASVAAGRLLASNITSGGGDTVDTPNATGGEANHTQLLTELVTHQHANSISVVLTDLTHTHGINFSSGGESATHAHAFGGTTSGQSNTHTHSFTAILTGANIATAGGSTVGNSSAGTAATGDNSLDHSHTYSGNTGGQSVGHFHGVNGVSNANGSAPMSVSSSITNVNQGSSTPANVMNPFMLGSWYIRL